MPTYEYACTSCGNRTEVVQRFSDDPLTVCEVCGGALKRVFHPVGIVLKGSGFYATDNRSKKSLTPASKDTGSDTKSTDASPSTEKKSEPKKADATKKDSGSGAAAS